MEVSGQLHVLATKTPGERAPGTHLIGGWVGPRVGPDGVKRKILHCWESNPGHPARSPSIIQTELSWLPSFLAAIGICAGLTCWVKSLRLNYLWGSWKVLTLWLQRDIGVLFSGNGKVALVDSRAEKQLQGWYSCHERSVRTVQVHPLKQEYFITSSALW
jgi:hypothetical protein